MAAPAHVFTIARVAQIIREDEATIVGPCNQHGAGRRLSLGLWYRRTTHDGLHGSRAGIFAGTDRRAQTQQRASAVVSSRLRSYGPTHRRADVVELKTRRQKSAAANHTNWCVSTTGAAASTGWILTRERVMGGQGIARRPLIRRARNKNYPADFPVWWSTYRRPSGTIVSFGGSPDV